MGFKAHKVGKNEENCLSFLNQVHAGRMRLDSRNHFRAAKVCVYV